jgi:hypothetical protein
MGRNYSSNQLPWYFNARLLRGGGVAGIDGEGMGRSTSSRTIQDLGKIFLRNRRRNAPREGGEMNDLGGANKMVDTPRTDEVNKYLRIREEYAKTDNEIWVNHARQLERELNAANAIIRQQQLLDEENLRLNERIKRLEEALESIREYWNRDNNQRAMVDACWYAIDKSSEALEAKEAKP